MQPASDYDDMGMIVEIATKWMQKNWQLAGSPGFENVRLFMKVAKTMATQNAIKMQQAAASALPPPPAAGSGPKVPHRLPPPGAASGPAPGAQPVQ
jgi:hypothetical protein